MLYKPYGAPSVNERFHSCPSALSLTPAPGFEGDYTSEFSGNEARFISKHGALRSEESVHVLREEPGEVRDFTLANEGSTNIQGELRLSFTPVLEKHENYASHPAFSKLFLMAEKKDKGALVTRRATSSTGGLSLFAAVSRNDGDLALECDGRAGKAQQIKGGEVRLTFSFPVQLKPGARYSARLAIALADEPEAASRAAHRALEAQAGDYSDRAAEFSRLPATAAFSNFDALYLLRRIAWPSRSPAGARAGRGALYARSISGDLPIVAARAEESELAQELLVSHRFLSYAGWPFDLVFSVPDEGYDRPAYSSLLRCVRRSGCEVDLGIRGGVHLIPRAAEEDIFSFASVVCPFDHLPVGETAMCEAPPLLGKLSRSPVGQSSQGEYTLNSGGSVPGAVWADVMSNRNFGCLAADCGLMGSWYLNARENRLTPWDNDPLAH